MCYGNPEKILSDMLSARPLVPNAIGHTPMDDFEHFCSYTGCSAENIGADAFTWAKLAYISARQP
ncbi:UNVERIFIED_ORG: hypothetical protein BDU10_8630 [Burkholderia sp. CF145]